MKHFFLILAAGCLSACATLSAPPHHAKFLNNDGATLKGASVLKNSLFEGYAMPLCFLFPDTVSQMIYFHITLVYALKLTRNGFTAKSSTEFKV